MPALPNVHPTKHRVVFAGLLLLLAGSPAAGTSYAIIISGDTTSTSFCTLRDAIRAARDDVQVGACSAGSSTDTITLFTDPTFNQGEEVLSGGDVDITISGVFGRTIDLKGANRFLNVSGGARLRLEGLTLRDGLASSGSGGALRIRDSSVELENVVFDGGIAPDHGGCLSMDLGGSGLTAELLRVEAANCASGLGGGGIALWLSGGATASLERVEVRDNVTGSHFSAVVVEGGGLRARVAAGSTLDIRRLEARRNEVITSSTGVPNGGGAYLWAVAGSINVEGGEILDNRSTGGNFATNTAAGLSFLGTHGGVFALQQLELRRNDKLDNPALVWQAHLYLDGAAAEMVNVLAADGGHEGVGVTAYELANATVSNLTVTGHPGRGLFMREDETSSLSLHNSLVWDNGLAGGSNEDIRSGVVVTDTLMADPHFVDPEGQDYHLAASSPAIDAGADEVITLPNRDLDGMARTIGGDVDLGAYEWGNLFWDGFESGDLAAWSVTSP